MTNSTLGPGTAISAPAETRKGTRDEAGGIVAASAPRAQGAGAPLDVPHVVDHVVDEVAGEGVDGEGGAVAAPARARPRLRRERVEVGGDDLGRLGDLAGDGGRVLVAVAVLDRRRVLVPVGVERVVLFEHQREAVLI